MSRDDVEAVVAAARKKNERANLTGANLTRVPVPVYEANLKGADLSGVDLSGANLHGANLGRTDLTGANLAGANLTRVPLYEANLKGADLTRANLTGVNLKGVDFTRAILEGATLSPSALMCSAITDMQWEGLHIGPTKVTDKRLAELRNAATTTNAAELNKYARAGAIGVRMAAASNEACPEELLMKLISDKREEVQQAALANPNCTNEVRVVAALQP